MSAKGFYSNSLFVSSIDTTLHKDSVFISETTTDFIEIFATKKRDSFARPVIEEIGIADNKFYQTM